MKAVATKRQQFFTGLRCLPTCIKQVLRPNIYTERRVYKSRDIRNITHFAIGPSPLPAWLVTMLCCSASSVTMFCSQGSAASDISPLLHCGGS